MPVTAQGQWLSGAKHCGWCAWPVATKSNDADTGPLPATPHEGRQLAAPMRILLGRFTDRLPPRTVQRIIAAAAGRTKLRVVLVALGMDGDRVGWTPT